ncbi:hypothetical protein V490_01687 [Pseudogymnoascus sp. VKM F-3557]|nr:hypothetical protein V490_01687 [Pseudogymnoascus sp. VKM F-3557]
MTPPDYHVAIEEGDWESSDQLAETDEEAESSDQPKESDGDEEPDKDEESDEDADSSDPLEESAVDDWESSDQLSQIPNDDQIPSVAPPEYSSIQMADNFVAGSSYELQGNIGQVQRERDLESGQRMPTKDSESYWTRFCRDITIEKAINFAKFTLAGVFGLGIAIVLGILLYDVIVYLIKNRTRT